jgi:hypothetical protein
VLGGARPFPQPVYSEADWALYCLPHGKTVVLTTLRLAAFKDGPKLVTWCTCNPSALDGVHSVFSTRASLLGYSAAECGHLPHECKHVQILKVWMAGAAV